LETAQIKHTQNTAYMKQNFSFIIVILLLFACNQPDTAGKHIDTSETNTEKQEAASTTETSNCYAYTNNKDSVLLHIDVKDKTVAGELTYNFYEKDKNTGTIQGVMSGDTIIADYSFVSEGVSSVREVVFLKKGNELLEGHGDADQVDNKMVFKDRSTLQFSGLALKETACPK